MFKYKKILIKISGEALGGDKGYGIDKDIILNVAKDIVEVSRLGIDIGITIGGGNFWRGREAFNEIERTTADHMGMLATVLNALALSDCIESMGGNVRVQTAISITKIAEPYIFKRAKRHFDKSRIIIFACGTGNPFFTTDTAAALKATEFSVDALLLAKNVDFIYDSDPKINKSAQKFSNLNYLDFIKMGLTAVDTTAISLCMENNIPIICFALKNDNIKKIINGELIGTFINDKATKKFQ